MNSNKLLVVATRDTISLRKLTISPSPTLIRGLYVRVRNGSKPIVPVYVDDGIVARSDSKEVESFIHKIEADFKITSGPLGTFFGMQIEERKDGILIHQSTYINKVLERFKMDESNPVATPCDQTDNDQQKPLK